MAYTLFLSFLWALTKRVMITYYWLIIEPIWGAFTWVYIVEVCRHAVYEQVAVWGQLSGKLGRDWKVWCNMSHGCWSHTFCLRLRGENILGDPAVDVISARKPQINTDLLTRGLVTGCSMCPPTVFYCAEWTFHLVLLIIVIVHLFVSMLAPKKSNVSWLF